MIKKSIYKICITLFVTEIFHKYTKSKVNLPLKGKEKKKLYNNIL